MDSLQKSEDLDASDFYFLLRFIAAQMYFGFKLYNQTNILQTFTNWLKNLFQ